LSLGVNSGLIVTVSLKFFVAEFLELFVILGNDFGDAEIEAPA
jgi:hypothetical protein